MVIILDNIRSIYNVGSIFRTADAAAATAGQAPQTGQAGVERIYLCGITPEPVDRFGRPRQQFVKVSLGAEKTVSWEKVKSVSRLIVKLKKEGFVIWAVEQNKKSVPYYTLNSKSFTLNKIALIFGNEVKGIRPLILKKCDKILEIPMRGKKESLNVAVAFGIIVYSLGSINRTKRRSEDK